MQKDKKYHSPNDMCHSQPYVINYFCIAKNVIEYLNQQIMDSSMKCIIYHANANRGMYSARLPNGSFTVFELVDPIELPRNTELSGDFEEFGDREVTMNNEERLHIHIENYGLNEIVAFRKTFLIS